MTLSGRALSSALRPTLATSGRGGRPGRPRGLGGRTDLRGRDPPEASLMCPFPSGEGGARMAGVKRLAWIALVSLASLAGCGSADDAPDRDGPADDGPVVAARSDRG